MKLFLILAAFPLLGQFRTIEVGFQGSGCASCIETLPERFRRLRGVETASLDDEKRTLILTLAPVNRVRLEQIRDFIEQDGTKALKARVQVGGEVSQSGPKWILKPAGVPAQYELEVSGLKIEPGERTVRGEVLSLRPESGPLLIRATEIQ